jgi:hypothetical protein
MENAVLWIRIRMFLGLPYPAGSVIILYGPGSFHQQALISTIL